MIRPSASRRPVPDPDVDLEAVAKFLDQLGVKQPTFQSFGEGESKDDKRLARILDGTLEEHAEALSALNRRGAGIFVSLNQTDGRGRKKANIKRVRAIFLDLDGSPLDPLRQCALKPHIVVESSPSRFHVYWRVKGLSADKFEDIQRAVAERFDGDPAVALLTACARLPGFFHNKAEPFQTRIIETNNLPPYTAEQILEEFPPTKKAHKASISRGESDDEAEIMRLARLDQLAYERRRDSAAKKLGISRVTILDKLVAQRRSQLAATASGGEFLAAPEPWPEPVVGDGLLNDLYDILDRHIILPHAAKVATALWIFHAHAHDAPSHSPILDISSPTLRCGKTQLLSVLTMLVPKPLSAANVTAATVFRVIERWRPTLLVDEGDTFLADKSELRGVLNSGHTRSQAYVARCVGDDHEPKLFSTWCAKAFAHIGRVHPTLEDRAIRINLRRKLKSEDIDPLPKDGYADLCRKIARWAADNLQKLKAASPPLPKDINDRAADNWRPLLAIADACHAEWGEIAREAAIKLSGVDDDESDGMVLLRDLRDLFKQERANDPDVVAMSSKDIAAALGEMEDRKWPEYRHGKPITPTQIARLLRPFKIIPRKVSSGAERRNSGLPLRTV